MSKENCKKIINFLKKNGIENQATKTDIEQAIMEISGTSDKTLRQYLKALQLLGFISKISGTNIFKLNEVT